MKTENWSSWHRELCLQIWFRLVGQLEAKMQTDARKGMTNHNAYICKDVKTHKERLLVACSFAFKMTTDRKICIQYVSNVQLFCKELEKECKGFKCGRIAIDLPGTVVDYWMTNKCNPVAPEASRRYIKLCKITLKPDQNHLRALYPEAPLVCCIKPFCKWNASHLALQSLGYIEILQNPNSFLQRQPCQESTMHITLFGKPSLVIYLFLISFHNSVFKHLIFPQAPRNNDCNMCPSRYAIILLYNIILYPGQWVTISGKSLSLPWKMCCLFICQSQCSKRNV